MLRGFVYFRCDDCGKRFKAPDLEWEASGLSVPQVCPECGSIHSYPLVISTLCNMASYRRIWAELDVDNLKTFNTK